MPKKSSVQWFKSTKSLSEIYQQTGMLFAFISSPEKGSKVCHEWVKCRDFLHDAVRSQITGTPCAIYGFSFNPSTNPTIDLKKTRMLVTKDVLKEEDINSFGNKLQAGLALINHFEKQAKITLSKLEKIDAEGSGKKVVYLFTGPHMWMTSPFLISMYTFLIRLGDKEIKFDTKDDLREKLKDLGEKYSKRQITDNDAHYLVKVWDKLHPVIKNRIKLFPKSNGVHDIFYGQYNISNFHNNGGIWSLSSYCTPDTNLNKRIEELMVKCQQKSS